MPIRHLVPRRFTEDEAADFMRVLDGTSVGDPRAANIYSLAGQALDDLRTAGAWSVPEPVAVDLERGAALGNVHTS